MRFVGNRYWGIGIASGTLLALTPITITPRIGATDVLKLAEACASHGNCCGGGGTCNLTNDPFPIYIMDQQHPSVWERLFGCNQDPDPPEEPGPPQLPQG